VAIRLEDTKINECDSGNPHTVDPKVPGAVYFFQSLICFIVMDKSQQNNRMLPGINLVHQNKMPDVNPPQPFEGWVQGLAHIRVPGKSRIFSFRCSYRAGSLARTFLQVEARSGWITTR
jgi:hypothetical protein